MKKFLHSVAIIMSAFTFLMGISGSALAKPYGKGHHVVKTIPPGCCKGKKVDGIKKADHNGVSSEENKVVRKRVYFIE